MAEVNTSIYQNQPNPLGNLTNVLGIANAAQQNQLLQTANQQRQLELQQGISNDIRATVGSMVNNPGLSQSHIKAAIADRARQLGVPVDHPAIATALQRYSGNDWRNNLTLDASSAMGPEGLKSRFEYKEQTGRIQNIPLPATFGRGFQTGMPTGFEEVAKGPGGAAGINDLLAQRDSAPQQKALLENLNALSNEAVSGPSADFEKRLNAFTQRMFGAGVTLTKQQLADSEEYGKISEQLAGQQATQGHATDAYLRNAYNTNPSLYLSVLGRNGINHMLQGNVDANVAKANAWTEAKNPKTGENLTPAEFSAWNKEFNKDFNPRVFQYARMTPEERVKFRSTMSVKQQETLHRQIQKYQTNGWIDLGG